MTRKILPCACIAIVPLVAAAWFIPPEFPMLLRQILLCAWGVGAIWVMERWLFGSTSRQALRNMGFMRTRRAAVLIALLASIPMWLFLPLWAWRSAVPIRLQADWPALLIGVILLNGITEEVIHRAFVFGRLRRANPFWKAVTYAALLFAAQHLYLVFSIGLTAGLASVLLALLLTFPLAFIFERGGYSLGGPAILHTSSNAPYSIFLLPPDFMSSALLPYMGIVLLSLYLIFIVYRGFPMRQPEYRMTGAQETIG